MITRTMLLALGKETTENLATVVSSKEHDTKVGAQDKLYSIIDKKGGVTSDDLLSLANTGKTLQQLERAGSRLSVVLENWDNGGKPPRIKHYEDPCYDERGRYTGGC